MEAIPVSIEGRIAIDVNFTDTSTAGGASSVKKISLVDTRAYSSGKVAIVTGTCGTSAVEISMAPTSYRDASGSLVSLATADRVAFQCTRPAHLQAGGGVVLCQSNNGGVSVSDTDEVTSLAPPEVVPQYTAGTAAYTAVFYGT
jgi:hypothetical protein